MPATCGEVAGVLGWFGARKVKLSWLDPLH